MYTDEAYRRKGAGRCMIEYIIEAARGPGLVQLSLETGSSSYFQPAVALYRSHGFAECQPFGDYVLDPNSIFMTLDLSIRRQHEAS